MKRYRFRLDPVLRVRRAQEDVARAALLAARARAEGAERALEERLARYAALPRRSGAGDVEGYLAARFLLDAAAATVVAAGKARELARADVGERRSALQEASTAVAALERLDARRREEHAGALRREEEGVADEMVTTRHGRGRR